MNAKNACPVKYKSRINASSANLVIQFQSQRKAFATRGKTKAMSYVFCLVIVNSVLSKVAK